MLPEVITRPKRAKRWRRCEAFTCRNDPVLRRINPGDSIVGVHDPAQSPRFTVTEYWHTACALDLRRN